MSNSNVPVPCLNIFVDFLKNLEYSERFCWISHSISGCTNTLGYWWGESVTDVIITVHIWFDTKVTRSPVASQSSSPTMWIGWIWTCHLPALIFTCYPTIVLLYALESYHFKSHWCVQMSLEATFMINAKLVTLGQTGTLQW